MNSNRITNLPRSDYPHEAATKNYVDNNPRKILHGYIPTIRSFTESIVSKCGFVVTSSSPKSRRYRRENV